MICLVATGWFGDEPKRDNEREREREMDTICYGHPHDLLHYLL